MVDFDISADLSQGVDAVMPLSAIPKLAKEQLISVKAHVYHICGVKHINSEAKGKLMKQEVIIRDTTSSTKLTLWEDYVNCLELNET